MPNDTPARLSPVRLALDGVFLLLIALGIWTFGGLAPRPEPMFVRSEQRLPARASILDRRPGGDARLTLITFRVDSVDGGQPLKDESTSVSVRIDDAGPIDAPFMDLPLAPGEHTIELSHPDFISERVTGRLAAGQDVLMRLSLFPSDSRGIANRIIFLSDRREGLGTAQTLRTAAWGVLALHLIAWIIYRLATRRMPYFSMLGAIGVLGIMAWYATSMTLSGLDGTITKSRTFWTFAAAAALIGLYALDALRATVPTYADDR